MLILSRKTGESIVIGEGPNRIVVTVGEIDRGKVRIAVTADRSIPVFRSELLEQVSERGPRPEVTCGSPIALAIPNDVSKVARIAE